MKAIRRFKVAVTVGLAVFFIVVSEALVEAKGSVRVAILDTGSNIAYKEGISVIDSTLKDYNGHGTLIARTIKEIYPEAELYIVKVMGKDGLLIDEAAVISGLEWATEKGVDIINMSLRLRNSDGLHRAIKKAYERGIVIVAAAGNKTSIMGSLSRQYSIPDTQYSEVAYPAKYEEVIAVGALDKYGRVYDGSIKDEKVEVFCRGYKGKAAGTSIASAYAAGFIARIIFANPGFGIEELRDFIAHQIAKQTGELK